jgi:two-component system chemotaxis response regulator CheY
MMKTILTVDDSRMMREMLLQVLRAAGFSVVQAEDGVEGLEVLERSAPDVIITDINMPRLDGYGFIEGVRSSGRATPILVLSTESSADKKDRARRAGATGWIVKPFDAQSLLGAIERVSA